MRFFRKCSVFRRSIPLIFELELKRMNEKEKTSCAIKLSDEPRWSLKTKKKIDHILFLRSLILLLLITAETYFYYRDLILRAWQWKLLWKNEYFRRRRWFAYYKTKKAKLEKEENVNFIVETVLQNVGTLHSNLIFNIF